MDGTILGVVIIGLFVYFVPYMIAVARGKENSLAIGLLNIFLGWTLAGWVVALVWAVMKDNLPEPVPASMDEFIDLPQPSFASFPSLPPVQPVTQASQKKCPDCAEMVLAEARKCRFCGYEFGPAIPTVGQP